MLNLLGKKKLLALVCAAACVFSLAGCQEVMEYVDNYVPPTAPETFETVPNGPTDPAQTTPAPTEPPQEVIVGVVTGAGVLNVRSGPGVEYEKVGSLEDGTKVAIYERQPVGESTWGRIKAGWISMNYIAIQDKQDDEITVTHSIIATVTTENLNIRTGPSSNYEKVGALTTGDKVQISEICVIKQVLWGKTRKGWLCMSYVQIDGTPDGGLWLTGTVNVQELMIRSGPGTNNRVTGNYASGQKIVITQLQSVDYVPWGKTDKGWVCMSYVIPDGNITVSAGS